MTKANIAPTLEEMRDGFVLPEEFVCRLKRIWSLSEDTNKQVRQGETDSLIHKLLVTLGYREGVEFLKTQTRTYA